MQLKIILDIVSVPNWHIYYIKNDYFYGFKKVYQDLYMIFWREIGNKKG